MLLTLSEEHRQHLSFLLQVEGSVVTEFGRIALEFLRRGTSPKIYEGAARKLGVPVETIQHVVEGLMFLMTESTKHMISEMDFLDSLLVLGLSDNLNQTLLQLYLQHRADVCSVLQQLSCSPPAYCDMHWRLDVQLASRSIHQQLIPRVMLSLRRTGRNGPDVVLQVDVPTVLHLVCTLEDALHTARSGRTRRFARSIK